MEEKEVFTIDGEKIVEVKESEQGKCNGCYFLYGKDICTFQTRMERISDCGERGVIFLSLTAREEQRQRKLELYKQGAFWISSSTRPALELKYVLKD